MTDGAVTDQLEYTETELLESHDFAEPLIAGGVRCHGGFDDDGTYVSPRTKPRAGDRGMAGSSTSSSSTRRCSTSRSTTWPEHYPNVAQSTLPPRRGRDRAAHLDAHPHRHRRGLRRDASATARSPICAASSTRTSTAPRWSTSAAACSRPTPATRPASRTRAATSRCGSPPRDIAFENPVTEDETQLMLQRMGINAGPGAAPPPPPPRGAARRHRLRARDARRADDAACCSSRSRRSTPSPGPKRARRPRPRRRRRRGRSARVATCGPTRRPTSST